MVTVYLGLVDPGLAEIRGVDRRAYFRRRLWEHHDGRCGICGEPVPFGEMHIDHILPFSHGGPTHWDNLQPSHALCNQRKNAIPRQPTPSLPFLRSIREGLGLSQTDLAERSGVAQATISNLEKGRPARFVTMWKLAKALDVEPAVLIGDES